MAPLSILERLQNAANRQDLASILNLKTAFLTDVIYRLKAETQYTQFTIPKKNGAPRVISAPTTKLKDIQRRLADVLYLCRAEIYKKYNINQVLSHGFEKEKSIITNAERHRGKTLLLNIDLEDYFDSFNFGRVRGFFLSNRDFRLNNTVATTIDFDARVYDLWMNDEEHTINNVLGDYVEGPSWMKKEGTTIKIEANTTGNPRSGVLTLNNGKTYKITQIDVQDFFGTWTLWSKKFNGSKSVGGSDGNNYTEVTFGEPRKKETLPDEEGHLYTNNFGVRGLYFDTVLDGTIVIDYEAKDIKVGFFVDCREAQPTGNATYPYAVYLPEGAAAPSWGNYNFQPTDFSETDYAWWWYNLSSDLRSLKYVFVGVGQKIGSYYVCGLSITPATGPNKADITKAYDCIYQANANTSDKNGMEFIKK